MKLTIHEIAQVVGAKNDWSQLADLSVNKIEFDSRLIEKGDIFLPLKGARDGHDFIEIAFDNGAIISFSEKEVEQAHLLVDDNLLAFQKLAKYYLEKTKVPVIAVTGSNGKTTTTTMIGEVLTAAGQHGLLSGNIGYPASQVAQTASDKDTLVMELSSFQLMGIQEFHPEIAVITNLMPTHIDYHGSFEEYVAAKWNIQNKMTAADFLVLNFNQDLAKELATKTQATVVPFSTLEKVDGAYLEDGQLYFRGEVVMAANEIGVPGSHNVENALATIAVAKLRGVDNQIIKETLSAFGGVKHRLQFVDEIKGVKFYNDSKSTNILATQKALSGFDNSKVILIAGGLDRGNEFDELVPDITGLKKMVILGQSAERVKRAADKAGVAYVDATDIADATRKAYELATQGDVVLLSPANASWDMYANFEVRGDLFIDTVAELKE